jgi:riboflavin kinase/FMN adenylyltransferase
VSPVEIAVGFFDGIHIGHRRIFSAMLSRAAEKSARSIAMTFINHPREVFSPDKAPKLLMSSTERIEGIKKQGVDEVVAEEFTEKTASTTASDFIEHLKREYPSLDTVFCGPNWTFGKGGEGNADFLRTNGIRVEECPFAELNAECVSSTRIRAALAEGDVPLANAMLGREYSVSGKIVKGKGLGREIGFPTVNLALDFLPPLRFGVYALSTPCGNAVANWGIAPSAGAEAWKVPMLEIHLLDGIKEDFVSDGKFSASFRKFLRAERKFDSFDILKSQIELDVATAIEALGHSK